MRLARSRGLVLRLLDARCTFEVPRIIFESADGDVDLRTMVPGKSDPFGVYARVIADAKIAAQIGNATGTILAQQHTRIGLADVDGWLRRRPE